MVKKVLIVAINSKYSHTNIATHYLKNCIKDLCIVETLNYTINDNISNILGNLASKEADIICFGCYIWNIEYVLKLSGSLNAILPDTLIAFGGPEVSYNKEEILNKYPFVSSIMSGEGENNIRSLVTDYINKGSIEKIYDIPVDIVDIPRITDDIIDTYDNRVVYFETSRGCPFKCSYCLSCIDKRVKYFNIDAVKEDILKLLDRNINQIRFIDRTFNSNKKRAIELWDFLIKNRKDTIFHFEICASLIDEETLEFLKTVPKNVFEFEIGIQSTNKETLESINRKYNFEYEKEILKKLKVYGNIKLHTDLIIGLPFETFDVFKNSFNELYKLRPDEIQVGFLKFLKGTDIYEVKDLFSYKYNDFAPFEVLENKFISYNEITYLKKFENIFETLYNSKMFPNTLHILEKSYETPFKLYEAITDYFDKHMLFDRKVSIDETFSILNDIYKKASNYCLINQALTYDYFLKFKGTRDWHFKKYNDNLKIIVNDYINKNRSYLFNNMNNTSVFKQYKFCILDFDFINNKEDLNKIYYINK